MNPEKTVSSVADTEQMMAEQAPLRLNIGCGRDIRNGWINVDAASLEGVDVVHDLNVFPLPFEDESVAEISCVDVLEHIDYIPFLRECVRILMPGGRMHISVPHFTSSNNFDDPTHIHMFSIKTFNFFCRSTDEGKLRGYYFDFAFDRVETPRIVFGKKLMVYNYLIQPLVNLSDFTRRGYDATGFSRLFPAMAIQLTLVK